MIPLHTLVCLHFVTIVFMSNSLINVLILGNAGRESAIFHKVSDSPMVDRVYMTQGNGGVPGDACLSIAITDFSAILDCIQSKNIHLLIVGPEVPLAEGIKDYLNTKCPSVLVFGPDAKGARLEASKSFAVEYMVSHGIQTAKTQVVTSLSQAIEAIEYSDWPCVIKADGLATGKGVSIHSNKEDAINQLTRIFRDKIFKQAGETVLLQKYMQGREASLFALCNGKEAIYLPVAQDYKSALEEGKGPNTGGMGAYCPHNILTEEQRDYIHHNIVEQINQDFSYQGILYIGLMVHSEAKEDVSVIEFNCRLGDPETQVLLPMLQVDIVPYLLWSCGIPGALAVKIKEKKLYVIPYKKGFSVNVVLATQGYPHKYKKGIPLVLPEIPLDMFIYHAGTEKQNTIYLSTGGRVVNVVAYALTLSEAREKVYHYMKEIKKHNTNFDSLFYFRKDIALY